MEKQVGHPAVYRPKTGVFSIKLTKRGVDALEASRRRHGVSRSDIIEQLIRRFHRDLDFSSTRHVLDRI